ncbi:MAG: erythromycin esterase family protein, partial [Proteobacteria bacterium]|nr:erythromycin esterase family protein [Pseudomonadota bacterium]
QSHYALSAPGDQFDAFAWFDETHAVTPLDGGAIEGGEASGVEDETYPFGV